MPREHGHRSVRDYIQARHRRRMALKEAESMLQAENGIRVVSSHPDGSPSGTEPWAEPYELLGIRRGYYLCPAKL
jgi:hypothetical protein